MTGLAFRFTGNAADALDVLQETYAYFFGKFPGFRLTAQLETFLYPAVRHLAWALRRKEARYTRLEHGPPEARYEPPVDQAATRSELQSARSSLTPEVREVLLLRFVDGFTLQEIAEPLDLPLGTVKSRLHYAWRTLRDDPQAREFFQP